MRAFTQEKEGPDSDGDNDDDTNDLTGRLRHALSQIPAARLDSAGKRHLAQACDIADRIAFRQRSAPFDVPHGTDEPQGPDEPHRPGQLDLGRFLFALQKQWVNRAKSLGSVFALLLTEDLPATVVADRALLEAALSNLLHHGFTDGHHRHIELGITTKDGAALCFTLQGDGRSFPLTGAETLTEVQDPALKRARQACEALGARLELRCVKGVRAEARCILPLYCPTPTCQPPTRPGTLPPPIPPARTSNPQEGDMPDSDFKTLLEMDETVFAHLLDLAGPDLARDLVSRFKEDLTTIQQQITAALPIRDLAELRSASHVLIALAGTAGSESLRLDARNFNALAHRADTPDLHTPAQALQRQIAALIRYLDSLAVAQGPESPAATRGPDA